MLVLFESAVGLALFKIKDGKLDDKDIHKQFDSPESANNLYVLTSPLSLLAWSNETCGVRRQRTSWRRELLAGCGGVHRLHKSFTQL